MRVTRYAVPVDAPVLKGLRIAVISDLHAGAPFIDTAKIDAVVAMTNAAKPDLILLTGDYVISGVIGGHYMAIGDIAAHLKPLRAPLGVYAVLGNHDHWEGADHIAAVLDQSGIPVLRNSHLAIPTARGPLAVVGIDDFITHASQPQAALQGLAMGTQALCFTHAPDIFPQLPRTCVLTIAGHTHGGQVWLPLLGRIAVSAASRYGQRYAIGVVREQGRILFVSPGIGTSGLPVRLAVPPEISLLTLQ